MNKAFTDIRIVGPDTEATQQSATAAGLRLMHLILSEQPPSGWSEIFEAERQFPRHSMWRRAWVEGTAIVVDCVPEELEQYHLRDLKEDVANSNSKFKKFLEQEEQRDGVARDAERRERERIEEINKRLNFE